MPRASRAVREHKEHVPKGLAVAVITISDTKDEGTDESGRILRVGVEAAGHRVAGYSVVPDEVDRIQETVRAAIAAGPDAVIMNGGTGVAKRDVTIEAVGPMLEKTIDGFGDLFRHLSYEHVGSAAMLSRAVAGVIGGVAVFCLPGSPDAVALAWERMIAPELPHLVGLLRR